MEEGNDQIANLLNDKEKPNRDINSLQQRLEQNISSETEFPSTHDQLQAAQDAVDNLQGLLEEQNEELERAWQKMEDAEAREQIILRKATGLTHQIRDLETEVKDLKHQRGAAHPVRNDQASKSEDVQDHHLPYCRNFTTGKVPGTKQPIHDTRQTKSILSAQGRDPIKLADPLTFNNSDRIEYLSWKILCLDKMRCMPYTFPTAKVRMAWLLTRLEGQPLKLVLSRYRNEMFQNEQEVFQALDNVYENKDATYEAAKTLEYLYQEDTPFKDFYGTFTQLALEANWDPSRLQSFLHSRLAYHIRERLIGERFESIDEMANRCDLIDRDSRASRAQEERAAHDPTPTPSQNLNNLARLAHRSKPPPAGKVNFPFKYPADPKTQRQLDKKLCFNCDSDKHIRKDCPKPLTNGTRNRLYALRTGKEVTKDTPVEHVNQVLQDSGSPSEANEFEEDSESLVPISSKLGPNPRAEFFTGRN